VSPADWKLIGLAVAAVLGLVLLITRFKLNAFLALMLSAWFVGIGSGMKPAVIITVFQEGLGRTLGGIAAIIGLGTMLGKLLAESGGATELAQLFTRVFGPRHADWCLIVLALVVGICTWFTVGLVLLVPILFTLFRESRMPFLKLALPLIAFLSVMHGLTPPHPGPVVAMELLGANPGQVLMWGFVIGIPAGLLAGPILARCLSGIIEINPSPSNSQDIAARKPLRRPGAGLTLISILLPVILMLLATFADLVRWAGANLSPVVEFLGNPNIALLVAVLFGLWSLGYRSGYRAPELLKFTEESIGPIGMMLLIVGGGGGFARVLKESGTADALGHAAQALDLSPAVFGWLVAASVRVAAGSATVAITMAAGLVAPLLATHPEVNRELLVIVLGCGSLFLSHLNDGGFWIVKDCLGLTVQQTLRTWTVAETIIGLVGLLLAIVV
jgi:GntP family gluconate:H+ symporter